MKKLFISLLLIISSFFVVTNVYAASASIKVKASSSQVVVGNTVTYTITVSSSSALDSVEFSLSYDNSKLTFVSSTLTGNTMESWWDTTASGKTKSKTYTAKFKAKATGTASVTVKNIEVTDPDGKPMSVSVTPASVTIKTQAQVDSSKSSVNTLSSLSVSGQTISPKFDKNTTNYTLTVPNNVSSVTINATATHTKATIVGKGTKELVEGANKFNIIVTAENGSKKTYTLTITRKELNPINIKVDGEEYTVIRKKNNIPNATNYEEATVEINGNEVPALKSDITKYTLIGATDKDGNNYLFIKDGDNYSLYKEFKFAGITLALIPTEEKIEGSREDTIKIGDETLDIYTLDGIKYPIIYGMNTATGEKNWYLYESTENTVQKLDLDSSKKEINVKEEPKEEKQPVKQVDDKFETITYILCGIVGLLFLGLLIMTVKISKNKKEHINY